MFIEFKEKKGRWPRDMNELNNADLSYSKLVSFYTVSSSASEVTVKCTVYTMAFPLGVYTVVEQTIRA
jgi:hypothetical protein